MPAIVDDGFALYESNAICEYLEEQYPQKPLLPKDPKGRALVRRLIGEADDGLYKPSSDLMDKVLYVSPAERDPKQIDEAKAKLREELAYWQGYLKGDFFAGRSASPTSPSIPICACLCGSRSARPAWASSARTCRPISQPG